MGPERTVRQSMLRKRGNSGSGLTESDIWSIIILWSVDLFCIVFVLLATLVSKQ